MAKKDKRIKGCPNVTCSEFLAKTKYAADDNYCKKCGTPLLFVCAKCFRPIEDAEGQRLCPECTGNKKSRAAHAAKNTAFVVRQKAPEALETAKVLARNKNVQKAAKLAAVVAAESVKNRKVKSIAKVIIKVVK